MRLNDKAGRTYKTHAGALKKLQEISGLDVTVLVATDGKVFWPVAVGVILFVFVVGVLAR